MKNSNYSQKLKDPRWQKKRLEILDRDSFTCQICFNEAKTLHVHHKKYEYGKEPWDIDDKYLVTLCEDCHELETYEFKSNLKEFTDILVQKLTSKGLFYLIHAFGNTNFDYSPDLYAEIVDDVFHSEYLEEIVKRKNQGWSSTPALVFKSDETSKDLDF